MAGFTDKMIAALKPKDVRYERWEGRGFGIRITPNGAKSWVWVYHFQGRPRRMTFGKFPGIGLADARIALSQAQKLLDKGEDPGLSLVLQRREEREAETVTELVEEYLEKWAKPRKRSAAEDERILRKDVLPVWGRRKAKSIRRRDVIQLLDGIASRGAPIGANRTLAVVRKMFNWAISRDIVAVSPCHMVKAPAKENRRDRVLNHVEIKRFWNELDAAAMSRTVQLALRFQLATAQRRGEVISAEWSDIADSVWTIPPEKSKNGMAHRVPLSKLAKELLGEIKSNAGKSRWLFPSRPIKEDEDEGQPAPVRSEEDDKPITGPAVDHALRRSRTLPEPKEPPKPEHKPKRLRKRMTVQDITPHDLRRTAASQMTSLGISRLVVSKILNHAEPGVTAVYDRHSYDREKRLALEKWGQHLRALLTAPDEEEDNNVVELRRG